MHSRVADRARVENWKPVAGGRNVDPHGATMRHIVPLLLAVTALSFASPASARETTREPAREPAHDLLHLGRGILATGAQISTYAACWVAIDDEETCVKIADRAMRVISD
jgi:hypothetical protein